MDKKRANRAARISLVVLACVVVLVGWIGFKVKLAYDRLIEMECRLGATYLVEDLVEQFLWEKGFTRWPESWAELEQVTPTHRAQNWPRDSARIQRLLTLDFGVDLSQVSRIEEGEFRPIRPTGPCYEGQMDTANRNLYEFIVNHGKDEDP